MIYPSE